MIIDATDMIVGRLASFAAKKALMGEKIDVINSEKAVVSGRKDTIYSEYLRRRNRGIPLQGPYYPRTADQVVRRTIRGMISYKSDRGKRAFAGVKCWIGIPEELKGQKSETVKGAELSKLPYVKYRTIGEICKLMGSK